MYFLIKLDLEILYFFLFVCHALHIKDRLQLPGVKSEVK